MNLLRINIKEPQVGAFCVTLEGPIDTTTHTQLDVAIENIQKQISKSIIIDMSKVNYISSMGVGSLFKIRKFAQQKSVQFLIAGLQPQVKKVLDIVQAIPSQSVFKDIKEMDEYLDAMQQKENDK